MLNRKEKNATDETINKNRKSRRGIEISINIYLRNICIKRTIKTEGPFKKKKKTFRTKDSKGRVKFFSLSTRARRPSFSYSVSTILAILVAVGSVSDYDFSRSFSRPVVFARSSPSPPSSRSSSCSSLDSYSSSRKSAWRHYLSLCRDRICSRHEENSCIYIYIFARKRKR